MSTILDPVYKRTSTGKVQEWTIEIDNGKYRTISGQVGGKSVTSEWTVCKGRNLGKANATTPIEQAVKEAEAKRRLKLEAEYRESVDDIDQLDFKEPLLAKDYNDYKEEINFPMWSQPKLDGVRCITTKDGTFSRNGKEYKTLGFLIEILKPVFELYPDIEFDGEAYNHEFKADFNKIISLVKQQKPTLDDLSNAEKHIQYWIYDIRIPDKNFEERNALLQYIFLLLKSITAYCVYVPTIKIETQEDLDEVYQKYLVDGYEGQMVRLNGRGYEFKRSKNLLKRKEFIDEDFLILDIVEGEGNRSGGAGYMVFEREGKRFKANIRGGLEYYKELLDHKDDYIKKEATVRYQNLTPDGVPRFPVVVAVRDYE